MKKSNAQAVQKRLQHGPIQSEQHYSAEHEGPTEQEKRRLEFLFSAQNVFDEFKVPLSPSTVSHQ